MNPENGSYTHRRQLFNLHTKENPVTCDNIDELREHYSKQVGAMKKNTALSNVSVEVKN